jgi:hypothetical protein
MFAQAAKFTVHLNRECVIRINSPSLKAGLSMLRSCPSHTFPPTSTSNSSCRKSNQRSWLPNRSRYKRDAISNAEMLHRHSQLFDSLRKPVTLEMIGSDVKVFQKYQHIIGVPDGHHRPDAKLEAINVSLPTCLARTGFTVTVVLTYSKL